MNVTETTVPRKLPGARAAYAEYPKMLNHVDGRTKIVKTVEEEDVALEEGWSETPPLIRPIVQPANMSTPHGSQAAYDQLRKQFDETVKEFNVRYDALERKYERLKDANGLLKLAIEQAEQKNQDLTAAYKSVRAQAKAKVEVAPAPPAPPENPPAPENQQS